MLVEMMGAREQRALLTIARPSAGAAGVENSVRGLLRDFGLLASSLLRGTWDAASMISSPGI